MSEGRQNFCAPDQGDSVRFTHEGVPFTLSQIEDAIEASLHDKKLPGTEGEFAVLLHDCRKQALLILESGREFMNPLVFNAIAYEEVRFAVRRRVVI